MTRLRIPFSPRSVLITALALLALVAAAPRALADQPVTLRAELTAQGPITLGDLFDGAGGAARVVIGAPAPVGQSAVLDAGIVQRLARQHGLAWENPGAVRRIAVLSVAGEGARMIEALTYTRNLMTGDVIQPTDLAYTKIPAFQAPANAPRDPQDIIGKVAARPLRSGAGASIRDAAAPLVIHRDDVVQVAYEADGISLTMQGKAEAAVGEPVSVLNTSSKKVVQAIASGPDQAVVGPEAQRLRAANAAPSQFASLR